MPIYGLPLLQCSKFCGKGSPSFNQGNLKRIVGSKAKGLNDDTILAYFGTIACQRHCDVKRVKETLTGQNMQSLQQSRNWSKPVQGFSHFWPRAHLFGCCTYVAEGKAYIWHEFPVITLLAPQGRGPTLRQKAQQRSILHQADNLRDPHGLSGCTVVHTFCQHRKI